ncbi:MAG TPA: hypothetical protein VJB69_02695 [Candidatus Paceibacterota bacterium]
MILFTYDRSKEVEIFDAYIRPNKSPEVLSLIQAEINGVLVDINERFVTSHIKNIENEWKKVERNFYDKLGSFYEIEIAEPTLTCFFTRLDIFPYNYSPDNQKRWFSAPLFGNNPAERIRVIMHELCHYFQPEELPRNIKEAIPVILNDHRGFQMWSNDKGHLVPEEQTWRKIIWDIYSAGKTFSEVLEKIKEGNESQ